MKLSSTINCKCNFSYCKKIFQYNKRPVGEKKYNIIGSYNRSYYECKLCNHLFAKINFKFKSLYSKEYFNLTYKNEKSLETKFKSIANLPKNRSDNKNRVERINDYFFRKKTNSPKRVLDIGSGIGIFLYEMKKLKWKTQGIEFDKNYTNFCNKKLKLNIINKNFLSFKPTRKFDLITFNKVLEHIANPRQLLKHATSLLNKNGVVYVEVPDSRVKKLGKFRDELNPAHLHLFSDQSLALLSQQTGLEMDKIQRVIDPSGKYTIFGFFKKNKL